LYQPALEFGKRNESDAYKYIFHKPASLSPYLSMFLPPNVDAEEDDNEVRDILKCKGIKDINAEHDFLKAEGHYTCSSCDCCFCSTCGYSPTKDRDGKKASKRTLVYYDKMNKDLCVDCYKEKVFLPFSSNIGDVLTLIEMKDYLKEMNKSIAADATAHEIQEMYEICQVEEHRKENIDNEVPYPIYKSKSLQRADDDTKFKFGEIIHTFPLVEGGLFISDTHAISNKFVIPIINLMANVVRYDDEKKNTHHMTHQFMM
jgi:hypothetical protein